MLSHPCCFQTTLVKKAMPHVVHAMDKFKEAYPVVQAAAMCLTNLSTGDVSSEAEVSLSAPVLCMPHPSSSRQGYVFGNLSTSVMSRLICVPECLSCVRRGVPRCS